jgi:hypothetical protein
MCNSLHLGVEFCFFEAKDHCGEVYLSEVVV